MPHRIELGRAIHATHDYAAANLRAGARYGAFDSLNIAGSSRWRCKSL